jgi:hypothetical protein
VCLATGSKPMIYLWERVQQPRGRKLQVLSPRRKVLHRPSHHQ